MPLTIQVPASTTNLGPGFDCLGAALRLWNRISIEIGSGEGPILGMVSEAADLFFCRTGEKPFPIRCSIEGDIPPARGLGSSVTIRLGVLMALDRLTNRRLSQEELCSLCAELEGHPDNAAAALFGGFTVIAKTIKRIARFDIDAALKFVLFVPDFEVKTSEARTVVPGVFPRQAVVENLAHASLITAAFASRQYGYLRDAFLDHLHQPFREQFVPFLPKVLRAAAEAGALGGFLSGSGSTVACLTLSDGKEVAAAMAAAAPEQNAKTLIVSADNEGARFL
jgi:homoserine kinase